ncbi:hypothetical protein GAMM_60173 [Gammaproteobacteria bacterium]
MMYCKKLEMQYKKTNALWEFIYYEYKKDNKIFTDWDYTSNFWENVV